MQCMRRPYSDGNRNRDVATVAREGDSNGGEGARGWQGSVRVARRARVVRERNGSNSSDVSSEIGVEWIGKDGSLAPACAAS